MGISEAGREERVSRSKEFRIGVVGWARTVPMPVLDEKVVEGNGGRVANVGVLGRLGLDGAAAGDVNVGETDGCVGSEAKIPRPREVGRRFIFFLRLGETVGLGVGDGLSSSSSGLAGRRGGGFGLNPRFLTCFTNATGLCFCRWNPKPVMAVAGISPFAIPFRDRKLRSFMDGRQE